MDTRSQLRIFLNVLRNDNRWGRRFRLPRPLCGRSSSNLNRALEPEIEILTEVHALDLRIATKHIRPPRPKDFAVIDNVRAISDYQSLTHIVVRHENANSRPLQMKDDPLQLKHLYRIDAGERLVEQKELWLDSQ